MKLHFESADSRAVAQVVERASEKREGAGATPARPATLLDRRQRLAECVDKLAIAIATGACTPEPVELDALAQLCEDFFLPREASRVRRWMARD